jgi:hypothetical protein
MHAAKIAQMAVCTALIVRSVFRTNASRVWQLLQLIVHVACRVCPLLAVYDGRKLANSTFVNGN